MALVEYENIRIELHKPTNADAFRREKIINCLKAEYGEDQMGYIILFARLVSQGRDPVNLPFSVNGSTTDAEIVSSYDCFMNMDEEFSNACWAAIQSMRKPVDIALAPGGLGEDPDPNSSSAAKPSRRSGASGQAEQPTTA